MSMEASRDAVVGLQQPLLPEATPPYQLRTSSLTSVLLFMSSFSRCEWTGDFDTLRNVLDKAVPRQ